MQKEEFENGMRVLSQKWPNVASQDQMDIFWNKWKDLPPGMLRKAADKILFECVSCPSGAKIQEFIDQEHSAYKFRNQDLENKLPPGCNDCRQSGLVRMYRPNERYEREYHAYCSCPMGGALQQIGTPGVRPRRELEGSGFVFVSGLRELKDLKQSLK